MSRFVLDHEIATLYSSMPFRPWIQKWFSTPITPLPHCQMAFFVQFAIAVDFRHDSGPLSIPCRWAFLLGSERGFGAAKWRLKGTGNRCRLTSPLSQKSVGEVCTISDSAWMAIMQRFWRRIHHSAEALSCPVDVRFCAAIKRVLLRQIEP